MQAEAKPLGRRSCVESVLLELQRFTPGDKAKRWPGIQGGRSAPEYLREGPTPLRFLLPHPVLLTSVQGMSQSP